jgi:hypothetical protein
MKLKITVLAEILELRAHDGLLRIARYLLDLDVGELEVVALHEHVEIHAGVAGFAPLRAAFIPELRRSWRVARYGRFRIVGRVE